MKASINELILKDYINSIFICSAEKKDKSIWSYFYRNDKNKILNDIYIFALISNIITCVMGACASLFLIEIIISFCLIMLIASYNNLKSILISKVINNVKNKYYSIVLICILTVSINIAMFFLQLKYKCILLFPFAFLIFLLKRKNKNSKKQSNEAINGDIKFENILIKRGFDLNDTYSKIELSFFYKETAEKNLFLRFDNKALIVLRSLFAILVANVVTPRIFNYLNSLLDGLFPNDVSIFVFIISIFIFSGFVILIVLCALPVITLLLRFFENVDLRSNSSR